jgi:hypothetical protein
MSDQSKLGLGQIITAEQQRDAIHVAVAPVIAGQMLEPGAPVALVDGVAMGDHDNRIGVVDPFLRAMVRKGERFWLFLNPGSITSLRHEWAHPAFGAEEKATCDKAASIKWVTEYAKRWSPYYEEYGRDPYKEFMDKVTDGEIYYYGSDCHGLHDVEDADELFRHLSIILGRDVRGSEFTYSCSC